MKKILILLLILTIIPLNIVTANNSGTDLIISEIKLSDPCFESSDSISVYVTVKNQGSIAARPEKASVSLIGGSKLAGANEWRYPHILASGEEAVYQFNGIIPESDTVIIEAKCDSTGVVSEIDESNNVLRKEFKSQNLAVDFEIESVRLSQNEFSAGDKIKLYAKLANNGGIAVENSKTSFIYEKNNGERIESSIDVSLKANQAKEFEIMTVIAENDTIEGKISIGKHSLETVLYNNTFDFCYTSINEKEYNWKNTKIYSGGFVPELISLKTGEIFAMTDVGGFYKFNRESREWTNLMKSISDEISANLCGIAVNEENTDIIYVASGFSSGRGYAEPNGLLRTKDGGKTWQDMRVPIRYDQTLKHSKGSLKLDPNCNDILYSGSTNDGLWVSENATADVMTFRKIDLPGLVAAPETDYSTSVNSIDFGTETIENGRSKNVYVATESNGIYMSNNGGKTFVAMDGSPDNVKEIKVDNKGNIYAARYSSTDTANNGLYKFNGSSWKIIRGKGTPVFSVDITEDGTTIAYTTYEMHCTIYYSNNNGGSFIEHTPFNTQYIREVPWDDQLQFMYNAFVVIDKTNSKQLFIGDWFGVARCSDVINSNVWIKENRNFEELCITKMVAPVGTTDVLFSSMDLGFGKITDYNEYDTTRGELTYMHNGSSVDYQNDNPNFIVVSGGPGKYQEGEGIGAYSIDGGATLNEFSSLPKKSDNVTNDYFGCVAVAAGIEDGEEYPAILGLSASNKAIFRSTDCGKTWEDIYFNAGDCSSFTTVVQLASDMLDKDYFYYYRRDGVFFVSKNNGYSFKRTVSDLPKSDRAVLRCFAQKSGHILLSLGKGGLWLSKDFGATFEKIPGFKSAYMNGTGLGKEYDKIFVYGEYNGHKGIFVSDDMGESFSKIISDDYNMGMNPVAIDGDKDEEDVVYVATGGFGIMVGKVCDKKTISVDSDGIYPVKVEYIISENKSAISVKDESGNEYKINYPVASGNKEYYVIDMPLNAGKNSFETDECVTSIEIYDKNIRRFEAEELSPDATYRADYSNDGSVFSTMGVLGEESQIFTDKNGNKITIGHEIVYHAKKAGKYTLKLKYFGYADKYVDPMIFINSTTKLRGQRPMSNVEEYVATAELSEGENKIYILRGSWVGDNYYPTNQNNMYTDYLEISPCEINCIATAETSSGIECYSWSDIVTDKFNMYADIEYGLSELKSVTIVTAVYEGDKLTQVIPETKVMAPMEKYPYKSLDIVKGNNTKAAVYIWDGITLMPYTNIFEITD